MELLTMDIMGVAMVASAVIGGGALFLALIR